ncbi:papain like cysteine protease AvrRpt2 [Methylobacter tundripaludum]|uniref:Papain like cysteine protease AvrRpt2 n=1 Tax=Methylobacter tundripaludum TaxID=173365 RepID=A0A2S6HF13_9GAMM|nr:C39 family peptidase [Methylobacter tundripaludum]PPK76030.1 papain like cysteine protease AvrRpt2 [Methylobacter tundripaludum]
MKQLFWGGLLVAIQALCSTLSYADVAEVNDQKISAGYEFQDTPVWCWAASIHMALKYYDIDIDQEKIVTRTFGSPKAVGGDLNAISRNLNYVFESSGKKYLVSAAIHLVNNSPYFSNDLAVAPEALVNHIKQGRPVVIAYRSSRFSGHAVVLSGVTYTINPQGRVEIQTLTVRDPFPYNSKHVKNNGKITYQNNQFPGPIEAIWFVDVSEV